MPLTFRKHPADITTIPSDRRLQHWVPAFYQRLWCDPSTPNGAFHWIRRKVRPEVPKRCSPRATFREVEINTMMAHGQRNLSLERMFSAIEDAYAPLVSRISSGLPLLDDDLAAIRSLIAAQLVRTPKFRGRIGPLETAENTCEIEDLDPESRIGLLQAIKNIRKNSSQIFTMFSFPKVLERLDEMAMELFISDDPAAFITSDAPCVLIERKEASRPTNAFEFLASKSATALMPLSPSVIAILGKSDGPDGAIRIFPNRTDFVYVQNAAILLASERYIVTNCKEIPLSEWLSPSVSRYLSRFHIY